MRLPYVPNSMVMDQAGVNLYFGSPRELMVYSTNGNTLTRTDPNVPGVVLAVSPNDNYLLINDQIRGLFYLYNASGSIVSTFGGLGAAAAWTQDSNTLYIVDSAALGGNHTNTLYVHDVNSGWSTYDLSASGGSQNLAVTVPGLGAWLAGNPTVAHTWCPTGTVGNNATIQFYPQPPSDSVSIPTSVLGATSDGQHILGASLNGSSITLDDIGLNIPPSLAYPAAQCPITTSGSTQTLSPLSTNPALDGSVNLTGVTNATAINQVVTGTAPTTASTTCRARRFRHLQHAGHFHHGRAASLLSASANRRRTRRLCDVRRQHLRDASTAPLAGAFSPTIPSSLSPPRAITNSLHRHSRQPQHCFAA